MTYGIFDGEGFWLAGSWEYAGQAYDYMVQDLGECDGYHVAVEVYLDEETIVCGCFND